MPIFCYLCGRPLLEKVRRINDDHVPPKQFFATSLNKKYNTAQMITIPVHQACNAAYANDETYFVHTLLPLAVGSEAGNALYEDKLAKFRDEKRQTVTLMKKVLSEFDERPGGVILPSGKVAKRFEGSRLVRVTWKIIRGLYYSETGFVLPRAPLPVVKITSPGETPPEEFRMFMTMPDNESLGTYQGVFAYRFKHIADDERSFHYWAFLLWDRIIVTAIVAMPPSSSLPKEK